MERTDTDNQLQPIATTDQETAVTANVEPKSPEIVVEPEGAAAIVKADALLVAALMGVRLNKNRKLKLNTQMSVPLAATSQSPDVAAAAATNSNRLTVLGTPGERPKYFKSITQVDDRHSLELSNLKPDETMRLDTISNASSKATSPTSNKPNSNTRVVSNASRASKCMLIIFFLF